MKRTTVPLTLALLSLLLGYAAAQSPLPPLVPCEGDTAPCVLLATQLQDIVGIWKQYLGNPTINAPDGMAFIRYNVDGTYVLADTPEHTAAPYAPYPYGSYTLEDGVITITVDDAGEPPACKEPATFALYVYRLGKQPVALHYMPIEDACTPRLEDLKQPLVWVAPAGDSETGGGETGGSEVPPATAIVTGPRDSRTEAPLNVVGEEVLVKVAGTDSNNQLAFFQLVAPPMSGPPLHVHTREDEMFYVLEGELVFQSDERRVVAEAGTTVYLPRGTTHTYQNFGDRPARLLIAVTPAGLDHFFEELSARTGDAPMPDPAVLEELHAKNGIKTMGPPLSR